MLNRKKTIFCDIDGTLVRHFLPDITAKNDHKLELLPQTIQKLLQWEKAGHIIILTTARKESARKNTEKQLSDAGIFYDQLIMGLSSGIRYLINDKKPYDSSDTAIAINLNRDEGISNINI